MIIITQYFKKNVRVLGCGLLLVGVLFSTGCNKKVEVENALSSYNRMSAIAQDSLGVLKFHDADSYLEYRDKLATVLDYNVFTEYFSSKEYIGYETSAPIINVKSLKGDITKDDEAIFKLDIEYISDNFVTDATMLITIRGNKVVYIERI